MATFNYTSRPQLDETSGQKEDLFSRNYRAKKDAAKLEFNSTKEKFKCLKEKSLNDKALKLPYSATLSSVDVSTGKNNYYKIELIHSNGLYYLYREYGKIATEFVQNKLNGSSTGM